MHIMRRQQSQDNRFEPKDEHEQPTEPMSQVIQAPFSSPTFEPASAIDQIDIPAPRPDERPFPKRAGNPIDAMHRQPATPPVYPVLPTAPPESRNGRPPGGVPPRMQPPRPGKSVPRKHRRSSIPALVRLFFFAVELVLLLSLLFPHFGLSISNVWVRLVYTTSAMLVQPFRLLLENVKIPLIYGSGLYNDLLIVIALLAYWLLSRILVRFLKALLHSR